VGFATRGSQHVALAQQISKTLGLSSQQHCKAWYALPPPASEHLSARYLEQASYSDTTRNDDRNTTTDERRNPMPRRYGYFLVHEQATEDELRAPGVETTSLRNIRDQSVPAGRKTYHRPRGVAPISELGFVLPARRSVGCHAQHKQRLTG